jgi:hypothetical protein
MKKSSLYLVYTVVVLTSLFTNVAAEDCSLPDILCVDDTLGPTQEYSTISAALDAASAGDTVAIYNGVYRESYQMRSSVKNWDGLTIKAADDQTQVYWQGDDPYYSQTSAERGADAWEVATCVTTNDCYRTKATDLTGYAKGIFVRHPTTSQHWRLYPAQENDASNVDRDDSFTHDRNNGRIYIRLADHGLGTDPDNYDIILNGNIGSYEAAMLMVFQNGNRNIDGLTIDGIKFRYSVGGNSLYVKSAVLLQEMWGGDINYNTINVIVRNCEFHYSGVGSFGINSFPGGDACADYEGPDNILIENSYFYEIGGLDVFTSADPPWGQLMSMTGASYCAQSVTYRNNTFSNNVRHGIVWLGCNEDVAPGKCETWAEANKVLTVERCTVLGVTNYKSKWGVHPGDLELGLRNPKWSGTQIIRDSIFAGWGGPGIQTQATWGHLDRLILEGNTIVYNCQESNGYWCAGLFLWNDVQDELVIKNNIFWGNRQWGTSTSWYEMYFHDHAIAGGNWAGADINYNLIDNEVYGDKPIRYGGTEYTFSEWQSVTQPGGGTPDANSDGSGDYSVDSNYPAFVDNQPDGRGDYHILSTSPAIDKGLAGLTTYDIDGQLRDSSPDIGADEYFSETTPSCGEGQITQTCLCGGTEYSSGYCCSGIWQNTACSTSSVFSIDPYLGDANNWEPLNTSRWEVVDDGGNLKYGIITTNYENLPGSRLGEYSLIRDRTYTDFLFNASVKSTEDFSSNGGADYDIIFGFQDPDNYYYMMFNRYGPNSELFRIVNGQRELIAETNDFSIPNNNYHDVELKRFGEDIKVLFNSSLILEAKDSTFSFGRVGIGGYNDASLWDDIVVREIHRADINQDGCVDLDELLVFIKRWKISSKDVPMPEVMEAIGLWNQGTGCG